MEIQPLLSNERAKIDVHRSPESVPTRKSLLLLALEIPEGVADVLKIEIHSALQQTRPLAAPVPKEMPVRTLPRFVTVGTRERFLLLTLRISRKSEQANAERQGKQEPTLSTAQAKHLLTTQERLVWRLDGKADWDC
jgi:hypothetical protein